MTTKIFFLKISLKLPQVSLKTFLAALITNFLKFSLKLQTHWVSEQIMYVNYRLY